jgi:uncharacterized membrane protein
MTAFCTLMGVLFGWTRLATGSIWPAVIGHGALNAAAGFGYVFGAADQPIDTAQVTILGWTGWLLPALLIVGLVVLKRLPVAGPREGERSPGICSKGRSRGRLYGSPGDASS